MHNRRLWLVLFVGAALYFVVRGPWRAIADSGDFLIVFSAARNWIHGTNPYLPADLAASAQAAGASVNEAYFVTSPSVYLPSALPFFAPLALLPWAVAKVLWLAGLLVLTLWNIAAFARMAKEWALPIASFLLAFAPLHTGLGKGQPAVFVCGLVFLSLFTTDADIAGLLLGIAVCIKPQVAAGFLLLALGQGQYRKFMVACGIVAVSIGIALAFLAPGWFPAGEFRTLRDIVGSTSRSPQWTRSNLLVPPHQPAHLDSGSSFPYAGGDYPVRSHRAAYDCCRKTRGGPLDVGRPHFLGDRAYRLSPLLRRTNHLAGSSGNTVLRSKTPVAVLVRMLRRLPHPRAKPLQLYGWSTRMDSLWAAVILRHETIALVLIWMAFVRMLLLKPRELSGTTCHRESLLEARITSFQPL